MRAASQDVRGRRLVAPVGLIISVAIIAGTAWWLAAGLRVQTVTVPVPVDESGAGVIPQPGPQALAIIETDALTADVVELVEAITNQSATVPGVTGVESVTNIGILTTLPSGELTSTPAFGSTSTLDASVTLEARAQRAAAAQLGTAGLLSNDGHTFLVAAELDPTSSPAAQTAAARSFHDRAALATSVSGLPVDVSFGGEALTAAEATESVRTDLALLVGLACLAPAAIALVLLRRGVPAGAVLAAGGAALLLAAILVNGEPARGRASPLDPDHPVTLANEVADAQLRGVIPVTIDILGGPGAFRRPDVLARMDALTTWLRDEYGVSGVDLPTTLRAEAGAITGVDSIPSNPDDIARLIDQTRRFDDGRLLTSITNDDFSRTRIVAWLPDEDRARLDRLASRLDQISLVVFEDLGIVARFTADVVAPAPARTSLARDLAILGLLGVALGGAVALLTLRDRHLHEERHRARHRRLFGHSYHVTARPAPVPDVDEADDPSHHRWRRGSLFARHSQERDSGDQSAAEDAPAADDLDRFEPARRSTRA